ncbi:MAG: hypothetical protein RBS09_00695, partial [Anaerolineaceae bacterium]|nr:hypothetical protein [Anaerolineaceae bacterium]
PNQAREIATVKVPGYEKRTKKVSIDLRVCLQLIGWYCDWESIAIQASNRFVEISQFSRTTFL